MAKNILPVDFQDDILNESMNNKRRYRMITNQDGTVSFEDVTDYDQIGSNFGQAQINATNEAVNESADKNRIIDNQDDLMANVQEGMIAGALAVKEIKDELNGNITGILINILTSRTVTVIGNTVFNTTFSPEIPDGYEAIGVVGFNTGHDAFYCRSVSTTSMRGYSTTSDTRTVTQSIRILCIKTGSL